MPLESMPRELLTAFKYIMTVRGKAYKMTETTKGYTHITYITINKGIFLTRYN